MKLTLVKKMEEVPNVISFIFEGMNFSWKAGQFLKYHLEDPNPDERTTNRYFTIATAPFEQKIMLTTRFDPADGSTFKKDLQNLQVGNSIDVEPPAGEFYIEDPNKQYVFIAGGIGVTPFRSILLDLDHNNLPINIQLLYANRNKDIVYKDELESLAKIHPSFKIHYFFDPQRIDEKAIRNLIANINVPVYYISGPKPMVQAMEKILKDMGIPEDHIKHDYFAGYKSI